MALYSQPFLEDFCRKGPKMKAELAEDQIRVRPRGIFEVFWTQEDIPISPATIGGEEDEAFFAVIAIW